MFMQNFRLTATHKFIAKNAGGVCREREMLLCQWLGMHRRHVKKHEIANEMAECTGNSVPCWTVSSSWLEQRSRSELVVF